jgi:hypothetical protein
MNGRQHAQARCLRMQLVHARVTTPPPTGSGPCSTSCWTAAGDPFIVTDVPLDYAEWLPWAGQA